MSKTKQKLSCY